MFWLCCVVVGVVTILLILHEIPSSLWPLTTIQDHPGSYDLLPQNVWCHRGSIGHRLSLDMLFGLPVNGRDPPIPWDSKSFPDWQLPVQMFN